MRVATGNRDSRLVDFCSEVCTLMSNVPAFIDVDKSNEVVKAIVDSSLPSMQRSARTGAPGFPDPAYRADKVTPSMLQAAVNSGHRTAMNLQQQLVSGSTFRDFG